MVGLAGLLDLGYVAFFAVGAYSWAIFGSPQANQIFGGATFEDDLAHEVIARFFPVDPPQFYMIPFGFHDSALIRLMLGQAGFADVQIESVEMESRSPSAAHVAVGLVRGNPVVNAIQERGGVEVGTVIAAVENALRGPYGDSPLKARMRAWVVIASPGGGRK